MQFSFSYLSLLPWPAFDMLVWVKEGMWTRALKMAQKRRRTMTSIHHQWQNHDHYHHPSNTEILLLHKLPLHR